MNAVGNLLSKLTTAATLVAAVAIFFMIVHICLDVIARNVFLTPIPATGGVVANYYMAAVSFLPVALAEKLEQHIAVEIVYDRLPERFKEWNLFVVRLVVALAAGGAAYGFLLDAIQKYGYGTYVLEMNVRVANWPGYFMLPIGFGLWSAISLYRMVAAAGGYEDRLSSSSIPEI